jgi:UDP-glucose 4-epimerase
MAVLVTGGAGYIGSFAVRALLRRGDAAVVLDDLSAGHRAAVPPDVPFVEGDLADLALIRRTIREHDVREVMHFAAFASVPESVAQPDRYYRNNTAGALGVLQAMREAGADRFIFSSTAATYGEPQSVPIGEDHPTRPTNPYGWSKRMVELMLEDFDRAYGLRFVALRYFNAAGGAPDLGEDHTPETHLIPLILQTALGQREAVHVFGDDYPTRDGTCVRDYIHVDDLAEAHVLALDYLRDGGESRILNLGNGQGYTVREVIDTARRITGRPIAEKVAPRRPGDPSALVASSDRARAVLGWNPRQADLATIVETAWQWHKSHPNGYVSLGARASRPQSGE